MNQIDNRFKISFLTSDPAQDKRSYSGSLYFMGRALEQHCGDVTYFEKISSLERRLLGRIVRDAAKHHFKRKIAYKRLLFVAKKQSKIATQLLAKQAFDVIIAPDAVPEIAFLQTNI